MKRFKFEEGDNFPTYVGEDRLKANYTEGDLLFREKEDDRGSYYYQKLIRNPIATVKEFDGTIYQNLKPTGKWWHEDDFAQKYLNNVKRPVHIVSGELRKNIFTVTKIKGTFYKGKGWDEDSY